MTDLKRLGKRGSYRLGRLRTQGVGSFGPPLPGRPSFTRPAYRGPAALWLLGLLAGAAVISGAAALGLWYAPFVVAVVAGFASKLGDWRARQAVPAAAAMAAAGWALPLAWPALARAARRGDGAGHRGASRAAAARRGRGGGHPGGRGHPGAGRPLAGPGGRLTAGRAGGLVPDAPQGGRGVNHGGMTDVELTRRAQAAGIATSYQNWLGEHVEVPAETIQAILAALGDADGSWSAAVQAAGREGEPGRAPEVTKRSWGFAVQLYSLRSRRSWGHGDLHDLADLATWTARDLGAGFVLVNPLHAAEPVPPVSTSPYLPMTRRYVSPLYLRIEDIPEHAGLDAAGRARIAALAAPLKAASAAAGLIDRDAVWSAKRAALELLRRVPSDPSRQTDFAAWSWAQGAELRCWASWCALAQQHGPDWRSWPAQLRDRAAGLAAVQASPELRRAADFHAWVQWLTDSQLAAAQHAAKAAGMAHGIIHDLAVGVHPGGADAWAHQDLLVPGMSVGAPPDSFNQRGQDWSQPPWHPRRLAAAGYRPLAELFGSALRHAGGLRVDHVMGLMRLWWIPEGMSADQGTYVRYDPDAAVTALAAQATAAGAVAVGEDLGTVADWIRAGLARHAILGTMMLWFAAEPDGSPLRPEHWRADCMATVGTHDVPTVAGFSTGEQVRERARLGLLTTGADAERDRAERLLSGWRDALARAGLLAPGSGADPAELTVALYRYLAAHAGPADLRVPGRRGRGDPQPEHPRHVVGVPELADTALRRGGPAGAGRGPARAAVAARGGSGHHRLTAVGDYVVSSPRRRTPERPASGPRRRGPRRAAAVARRAGRPTGTRRWCR